MGDFVVPYYVGKVITALGNDDFDLVGTYCLHLFIIVCCGGVFTGLRSYTFNILAEKISRNLRRDFFHSIISKDIGFFDERRTGDLLSRITSDTQVIQDTLATNASMFVRSFVFIILTLVILMIYSPALTGVTLLGIIPTVIFGGFFGTAMKKLTKI